MEFRLLSSQPESGGDTGACGMQHNNLTYAPSNALRPILPVSLSTWDTSLQLELSMRFVLRHKTNL